MINIIGGILGTSGYDVHTRQLANALNKYVPVKLVTQVPGGAETLLTDKELEMIKRKDFDINLIITNPIYWRAYTTNKRNWAFLIWEGDKVPKSFVRECLNDEIEYIFVASSHTQSAVLNTLKDGTYPGEYYKKIRDKLVIIPHGVNLDLFYPKEKPTDKFRFLCNKGFRNLEDRGGIQYAIQAYLEEFNNNDNVELIVKINPAYPTGDLNRLIGLIAPKRANLPPLRVSLDPLPYDKMVNFYNQCNVLVSPTRAEAYNLPCIEALACGLPVITTNFGGQTDFVNEDNGWLVDGKLTEIHHEVAYEGIKWLTPNIVELRKAMRQAYNTKLDDKIKNAIKTAQSNTWDMTASKIVSLLNDTKNLNN